ncbi:hypothetical protein SAMN06265338_101223 [Rhodoblastus acidophilus]|uniref:Uncharacterized protein n=1 Tax=Rhodoblastus acidophilus TaxID=1074 RepID=A0A212PZ46_RHOAC|nr:hypothetical protein SAMN06265338_101223 [Rhodoblastus acidophilus]
MLLRTEPAALVRPCLTKDECRQDEAWPGRPLRANAGVTLGVRAA